MLKKLPHLRLVIAAAAALVLIDLAAYTYYYYEAPGPLVQPKTLLFKRGTGFRQIVDDMHKAGVIRYPLLFKAVAVGLGDARQFKAGEYRFSAAISPRLIMDMIAEGRVVVHKVTVPEGLTAKQVTALLASQERLEGDIAQNIEEGSLLPQTYHYTYGDQRQELVNRMRAGMATAVAELWEKRQDKLPFASPAQAVILASIVEKETDIDAERGRIAAVFINRLKKGMRLQSDPTVIYAIERDKGDLGRTLILADLAYDSPYNTYKYAGLPPSPIANPGRSTLAAVLNPPASKELYFVATGTGGHHFSATLDGHNKNVREYKKALKPKPKQP